MLAPVALLLLDVLANGQALDHFPFDAGRRSVLAARDLALALGDLLRGPDRAFGHVMKRTDDTFAPRPVGHRRSMRRSAGPNQRQVCLIAPPLPRDRD